MHGFGNEALRITPGLVHRRHDVLAAALGLDDAEAGGADEQRVVGGAVLGRPFGDREVAAGNGARACGIAEQGTVGIPLTGAEPGVDQGAGRSLIKVDLLGRLSGQLQRLLMRSGRRRGGGGLEGGQLLGQRRTGGFRLGGIVFPERTVFRLGVGTLLGRDACGFRRFRGLARQLGGGKAGIAFRAQPLQLLVQRGGRVRRRTGWLEGTRLESRVAVGLVEPDGELPRDLEAAQRGRMIATMLVGSIIPEAAEIMKEVENFARIPGLPAEPRKQLGLGFVRGNENTGPGGHLLRQQLAKLPQLHQRGHGMEKYRSACAATRTSTMS